MSIKITDSLDEKTWRDFVYHHPQGNIFHTPEMFQVFAAAHGHRPLLRAALDENGAVLALLLPVMVTLMNGPFQTLTTRSICYGSVLCSYDPAGEKALETLLKAYTREMGHAALFTELRNLSDQSHLQTTLKSCGFGYEDHLNFLIDLGSSSDEVFQKIGARTRKHIRRELNKGEIVIEQITSPYKIKTCYEVIRKSYATAHVPIADVSLFEATFNILSPQRMAMFTIASMDGIAIGASVELMYKDVVLGWYGGVDRAYSRVTPNEVLTWHILKWGSENGFQVYDFGGAGTPKEKYGVRDFKTKFGGRLVCFGRNTCVHSPALLNISKFGYSIYRKLFIHQIHSRGGTLGSGPDARQRTLPVSSRTGSGERDVGREKAE